MNMTGTLIYLVGWTLLSLRGSKRTFQARNWHRRGWREARRELPAGMVRLMSTPTRILMWVWTVRLAQVVLQALLGGLFIFSVTNPQYLIAHRWFPGFELFFIGFFYYLEGLAWNVLADIDIWLSKRASRQAPTSPLARATMGGSTA